MSELAAVEALAPIATKVLQQMSRGGKVRLVLVLDRSLINDTLNLLWVAAICGISCTQLVQLVAQKFTRTTCPRSAASSEMRPSSNVYVTSGAISAA